MTEDYLYVKKSVKIKELLQKHIPNKSRQLRVYAISRYGLLTNQIREKAWPLLINVDNTKLDTNISHFYNHKYYSQVTMDVERSLKRYPPGLSNEERKILETKTVSIIMNILQGDSTLHYYQGYHDIVITFILILDENRAYNLIKKLSMTHFREFMAPSMVETGEMLGIMYPLLDRVDAPLSTYLQKVGLGTIFCLSWLITWFGHVLNDLSSIARLYDFFIACPDASLPMYVAAAVVLYRRDEIYSCEYDMPELHKLLTNLPSDLPVEDLIDVAANLYLAYPPHKLESARRAYLDQMEAKVAQTKAAVRQQLKQRRQRAERPSQRARKFVQRTVRNLVGLKKGKFVIAFLVLILSAFAYKSIDIFYNKYARVREM